MFYKYTRRDLSAAADCAYVFFLNTFGSPSVTFVSSSSYPVAIRFFIIKARCQPAPGPNIHLPEHREIIASFFSLRKSILSWNREISRSTLNLNRQAYKGDYNRIEFLIKQFIGLSVILIVASWESNGLDACVGKCVGVW